MKEKKTAFQLPEESLSKIKTQTELEDFIQDLYKQAVENMLKAEMTEHLGYLKHNKETTGKNSRNGTSSKTLKTSIGDIPLDIPRDREASFEPVAIPKHQRMSSKLEQAIITMYSKGMSTRDIEDTVKDIYGISISESSISSITHAVVEDIKQWQNRPLESVYFTIWMDGIVFKIRHNGRVINKTIYIIIGLTNEGHKEVLGLWISETESAAYWVTVLTDLRTRGVNDILICCSDNLAGINQAIEAVFPKTISQLCIVHQLRNSCRYVVWKDKKEFAADLKTVYAASNEESAKDALIWFEKKWGHKYGYAIKSWQKNWPNLTPYFDFPVEIRRIIYTTNAIESLNSTIRKYTKTKNIFPDDQAALKSVYLAIVNVQRKWVHPIRNWGMILNQFIIKFEDRCLI